MNYWVSLNDYGVHYRVSFPTNLNSVNFRCSPNPCTMNVFNDLYWVAVVGYYSKNRNQSNVYYFLCQNALEPSTQNDICFKLRMTSQAYVSGIPPSFDTPHFVHIFTLFYLEKPTFSWIFQMGGQKRGYPRNIGLKEQLPLKPVVTTT